MNYFAKIDIFYKVLKVIVSDQDFVDTQPGMWIPCDIEGISPKNYPGIGYTFNIELNGFIPPKPYPSWSLNGSTCKWDPPIPYPEPQENKQYLWNEETQSWEFN